MLQSSFRVGGWMVHPGRHLIEGDAGSVPLEPRVMELLLYLADRPNQVIGPEQLLLDIWKGTFYGDSPVQKAVALLRKALGDDASSPTYIETIRKRGYRLIANVVLPDDYATSVAESKRSWSHGAPYIGLKAYGADHAEVFFGRSRAIANVMRALRQQVEHGSPFVLIAGHSGCGKSSLINAGVLPLLTRPEGFDGIRVISHCAANLAAISGDSIHAIAKALATWKIAERPVFAAQGETLAEQIEKRPESLVKEIHWAFEMQNSRRAEHGNSQSLLLLVLDHAEGVLTDSPTSLAQQKMLGGLLSALCQSEYVAVMMACRSDLYPRVLAAVPEIAELKSPEGHIDLLPPSSGELAEIIRGPARAAGIAFEKHSETAMGLDDVLRDAAMQHPQALPLLQFTLHALYEECRTTNVLSFAAYQSLGGMSGALAQRAETVFESLSLKAQIALPRLLALMVVSHEISGAVTARRVPWNSIVDVPIRELVTQLVDARLLVSELIADQSYFTVAHESLLSAWPRIREWAQDNQQRLRAHARLRTAAQRWLSEGKRRDLLLPRGSILRESQELQAALPDVLNADEDAFLRSSNAAANRWQRIRIASFVGAIILAVVAIGSATLAQMARVDADQRRDRAENLILYLLSDFAQQLRPLGKLDLMDGVAGQSLEYFRAFPEQDANLETNLLRAQALRTMAEVFQARTLNDEAAAALDQARVYLGRNSKDPSLQARILTERGMVEFWHGNLEYGQKNLRKAFDHMLAYRHASQQLVELQPENNEALLELSYALNNLGTMAKARGEIEPALDYFKKSVVAKRKLIERSPDNISLAMDLADSLSWLGSTMEEAGKLDQSRAYFEQQQAALLQIPEGSARSPLWRHRKASSELLFGRSMLLAGQNQQGILFTESAVSQLSVLHDADKSNKTWQRDLAAALWQLASIQIIEKQFKNALDNLTQAKILVADLLTAKSPPVAWRRLEASVEIHIARSLRELNQPEAALATIERAGSLLEGLLAQHPQDMYTASLLAQARVEIGDQFALSGQMDEANTHWLRGLESVKRIALDSVDYRILEVALMGAIRLQQHDQAEIYRAQLKKIGYRNPAIESQPNRG